MSMKGGILVIFSDIVVAIRIEANLKSLHQKSKILICEIYRPLNKPFYNFYEALQSLSDKISNEGLVTYFLGIPLVNQRTRATASSLSLIDVIFTNELSNMENLSRSLYTVGTRLLRHIPKYTLICWAIHTIPARLLYFNIKKYLHSSKSLFLDSSKLYASQIENSIFSSWKKCFLLSQPYL